MPRRKPAAGIAQLQAIQEANIERECLQLLDGLIKATHIDVLAQSTDSCETFAYSVWRYRRENKLQTLKKLWPAICKALTTSLALLERHCWQQQQEQQQQQQQQDSGDTPAQVQQRIPLLNTRHSVLS
jgi:hypothetical protein